MKSKNKKLEDEGSTHSNASRYEPLSPLPCVDCGLLTCAPLLLRASCVFPVSNDLVLFYSHTQGSPLSVSQRDFTPKRHSKDLKHTYASWIIIIDKLHTQKMYKTWTACTIYKCVKLCFYYVQIHYVIFRII